MSLKDTLAENSAYIPQQFMRFWEFRTQAIKFLFASDERTQHLISAFEEAKAQAEVPNAAEDEKRVGPPPPISPPRSLASHGTGQRPGEVEDARKTVAEVKAFYAECIQMCIAEVESGQFEIERFLFERNPAIARLEKQAPPSIEQRPFAFWRQHSVDTPDAKEAWGTIAALRAQWTEHYFQFVSNALYDGRLQAFVDWRDNNGPQPITNQNWWMHPRMREGLTTKGDVSQSDKVNLPPLFLRRQVDIVCPLPSGEADSQREGKQDFAVRWLNETYPDGKPADKAVQEIRKECISAYGAEISETLFRTARKTAWGDK